MPHSSAQHRLVPRHAGLQVVGVSVPRSDAPEKVLGTARYVDDLSFADQLHARVLRSPHAHARILRIDVGEATALPGVRAVLTARDVPGVNVVPMVKNDWPALAEGEVNHVGEPVAIVAAESREMADRALAAIRVVYDPLPAVLTIEDACARSLVHAQWKIVRGDVDAVLARPDVRVVRATYHTPHQEHAYLETNGVIAVPDGQGGMTVHGSLQCPFYVQKAVASVLGLGLAQVRVIQATTGGGFGGKEDVPSQPAALCSLLAWKTGRPVRLVYGREEDMRSTSKRHPGKIDYGMAVGADGIIQAVEVDCFLDGGAYATLSPVVLFRALVHAAGPYRVENARINATAVRTHTLPCGAFRGFGEPQVVFAGESHVDRVAAELGLDPLEFRRRNLLDYGDLTVTGQRLEASVGMAEVLDKVLEASDWHRKRQAFSEQDPAATVRHGIGLAVTYYGVGLGAQGRNLNAAGANLVVSGDGTLSVAVGTTEIGQGMDTVLAQVAAEELECPLDLVTVIPADTALVPDSGPTVASRTTVMSGNAIRDAAQRIKKGMQAALEAGGLDWDLLTWKERVRESVSRTVQLSAQGWVVPPATTFDADTGQGSPYMVYTWSANTVEVEVDTETGTVTPVRVVSGHDVGKVVNVQLGEGQVEGGVVQGLGYALVEEHVLRDGHILNPQFSTYIIPTPMDAPDIVPILVEHEFPWGPYGAKGLGETPLIPVAPALVNAVAHATGVRLTEIPATPERVWRAGRDAHVPQER